MYKITAPTKDYNRVIAGCHFVNGQATTDDAWLAQWFAGRGFKVEASKKEKADKPKE